MDQKKDETLGHEPFHTLKGAAAALGAPYFNMQRAARQGNHSDLSLLQRPPIRPAQ